ncbi:H/ACA RNA-protein complex protein Gar1 [Stygiolobus caldivivus]|uniref:H/ACA RNA-protein complex protein Gar1 n=1 Tax=Stygiolobus caldivivus TaxID=2824673 RepID=A0A8D5ZKE0_9CREN|nr:H/ACA RNA-protein complex protein Gar1 [Stygiolobus caldivivus]BCU71162.1 H/ACA RNA-protein complex protein Gar1 [Stygiolobus caldivivus]
MTKVKLVEAGNFYKDTLGSKWLIEGKRDIDYSKFNYIGKIVVTESGKRIAKVLDIIGNVNKPYILVEPLVTEKPKEKMFIEIVEKKRGGKRK